MKELERISRNRTTVLIGRNSNNDASQEFSRFGKTERPSPIPKLIRNIFGTRVAVSKNWKTCKHTDPSIPERKNRDALAGIVAPM